jgi:hypothetical protein
MRKVVIVYEVPEYDYPADPLQNPELWVDTAINIHIHHNLHGKPIHITLRKDMDNINISEETKNKIEINL